MANPSLNNWTFIPQVAYTKIFPESGFQLDTVAGVQFYTRNNATDYRNAPLFSMDVMGRKIFSNGVSAGLILGTIQQLGSDSGPTADRLNGFKGRDWALGPIVTYDTKLADKRSLSLSLRCTHDQQHEASGQQRHGHGDRDAGVLNVSTISRGCQPRARHGRT